MTSTQPLDESVDQLVQRVRKLLDKAEGTDNPHEAEMFAGKAAELVARHRIRPEQLAAEAKRPGDLRISEINIGRGAYARGRLALLTGIADGHDVRVVFRATPEGTIAYAAGHADDLEVVEMMYHSLHQQASGHMAGIKRGTGPATQRFRRSFLFGFADRIGQIVAESRRAVEAESDPARASSTAVALRDRAEHVDGFVTESWGRVRSASAPKPVQPAGFARGMAAAEQADVGRRQLGGRGALGRGRR